MSFQANIPGDVNPRWMAFLPFCAGNGSFQCFFGLFTRYRKLYFLANTEIGK